MKYNPEVPFAEQEQSVKDFITFEVMDQTQEPKTRDELRRPKTFEFHAEDENGLKLKVTVTNHYIDNRSWRLHNQSIDVEIE